MKKLLCLFLSFMLVFLATFSFAEQAKVQTPGGPLNMRPFWEQRQTLLLNPGSAADGRIALLEINNGKPRFKLLAF